MAQSRESAPSGCAMARQELLRHLIDEREMLLCDAMRIIGNRDRAEDVVQDAAMRCLNSKAIGVEIASPRGFLRRIVRNLALDHLRRELREGAAPLEPGDDLMCDKPTAETQLQDSQRLRRLAEGLMKLPARDTNIIFAHRLRVESQKDIAQRFGLSPARINGIITRSQKMLVAYVNAADANGMADQSDARQ
ncbi:sigma-70 family RNA polymerase sigma factor [Sulfitobacter sp. EhC04]|uniref:sigma-70 family RNA polymerase sigma factor n=1 Tax=Sulfitobacter sp. EhC04 TaxID=1849168 RepID=UPI00137313DD|nr:sigma-70 family RNA polymerase sigma factor [Sulfitobacter sp. EhC04]